MYGKVVLGPAIGRAKSEGERVTGQLPGLEVERWQSTPGGAIPVRRPLSIRRTSSLDMFWPEGRSGMTHIAGAARDIFTDANGEIHILDYARIEAVAKMTRELVRVDADSRDSRFAELAGVRAGGQLRGILRTLFPDPAERDTAQYLLLDDLAGATLVSSWGWFAWEGYHPELIAKVHAEGIGGNNGNMLGVCIGLANGSSSIDESGRPHLGQQSSTIVPSLINDVDPDGWHTFAPVDGPHSRRARWIDLSIEGGRIAIDTGFQDSAARPDGLRQAIHEYRASAQVDLASGKMIAITATPYVLPHLECPAAVTNIQRLLGQEMSELRDIVPQMLAKELGCTHLNDVLRALSATQFLANQLELSISGGNR